MTNPDFVIPFETATYPTLTCIDDPALVDTPYSSKSWRCFTDASGRAVSGIWEAGPHFERCICDFDEMCHILEGEVRLTDASGRSKIFGPNWLRFSFSVYLYAWSDWVGYFVVWRLA